MEFVSGNGSEQTDKSPWKGKFWVYETVIHPAYYAIYEVKLATVEVYQLIGHHDQRITPNEQGHYLINSLGIALGIWQGTYQNMALPWLRWWDDQGNLLLTGEERAEQEKQRAEYEKQRAERLAEKLRKLAIAPDDY